MRLKVGNHWFDLMHDHVSQAFIAGLLGNKAEQVLKDLGFVQADIEGRPGRQYERKVWDCRVSICTNVEHDGLLGTLIIRESGPIPQRVFTALLKEVE